MKVLITKSFTKSFDKLPATIQDSATNFYHQLVDSADLRSIANVKKLKGYKIYYRYKIGDYRLGFKLVDNEITLLIILHRKEIYRQFP